MALREPFGDSIAGSIPILQRRTDEPPPHDDADVRDEPATLQPAESTPAAIRAIDVTPDAAVAWTIEPLFTAGDFGLIVGEDGVKKSTLMLHFAGAKAGGYRALGHFGNEPGAVYIVSEEDSAAVIRNRLEAMCRGHGWNRDLVLSNVWILAKAEIELASPVWRARMLAELQRVRPAFIIADPLAEMLTGEENSNTDARPIIKTLRAFGASSGAAVPAIHHYGKPTEGKKPADRIRGASAFRRASRFIFLVEDDDSRRELTVTCLKMSRTEKPAPFIVRYSIESDPANRAIWTSARFDYVSTSVATLDHAEAFVLERLSAGDRINTTDLKKAAAGTGVSGQDIARALKSLVLRHRIDFVEGPKGSKIWGLVVADFCLPEILGNHRQPESQLAGQLECLPGNDVFDASACLGPIGPAGKQNTAIARGNQHDENDR